MQMHDDDMSPEGAEDRTEEFDFGYWPDIAGLVAAGLIIWAMFRFSDGVY